jgi:hypothetical protein
MEVLMMSSIVRQLEKLLQYPKEDLDKEYKNWLDLSNNEGKADLAKAIIALANHGGGYVVLGYEDDNSNLIPAEPRPTNLNQYSQDAINEIIHRYADPVFHCECREVTHPESRLNYPIIIVPGGHTAPIRTKRAGPEGRHFNQNEYLIRRPGPRSESPQSAQEWNELINRCIMNRRNDLLESLRSILTVAPPQVIEEQVDTIIDQWVADSLTRFSELVNQKLPTEHPSRYSYGKWYAGYLITGDFERPELSVLTETIRSIQGNETGWPAWLSLTSHSIPYPYEGTVECLILPEHFSDGAHSDFWRASPDGKMFLLRGYQEDGSTSPHEPGTVLDFTLPIWRIGECVLHSARLANKLSEEPLEIALSAYWDGLENRTLISWANPRYALFRGGHTCHTKLISSKVKYNNNMIETNFPEIVNNILKPLYEAFDYFKLPSDTLIYELKRLQKQI